MRFVSYNIHRAVGSRGRPSIRAVGDVLRDLEPDVIALNEVVRTPIVADQAARLGSMLRMAQAFRSTTRTRGMLYGNAVLVRGRILDAQHVPLPAEGAEPRGVLFVDAEVDGVWFTFGCTHLEPRPAVRQLQLEALAGLLRSVRGCDVASETGVPGFEGRPLVLAGDLNAAPGELGGLLEVSGLELAPPRLTFPASGPRASIDHVLFSRHWRVVETFTVAAPVSDHAALVVDLELIA